METLANIDFVSDSPMWNLWLGRFHLPSVAASDTLGVFTTIAKGIDTTTELAKVMRLDLPGIEALTTLLASLGLLNKRGEKIALTSLAQNYLLPDSPFYWGHAFNRIYESVEYKRLLDTFKGERAEIFAQGKSLTTMWEQGDIDPAAAREFTKIMHCTILPAAVAAVEKDVFAGITHLLDIGGGSGCFANNFVKHYKGAKATIFELPAVCDVARSYLKDLGTLAQIDFYHGNFFKDAFPKGTDGILFSNIFHDWKPDQALLLARKAYDALPTGGKIFVHEMLLNEAKNGPLTPATFNLLMYMNHGSQQFTQTELFTLLQEAGFVHPQRVDTHPHYSVVIAEKLNEQ